MSTQRRQQPGGHRRAGIGGWVAAPTQRVGGAHSLMRVARLAPRRHRPPPRLRWRPVPCCRRAGEELAVVLHACSSRSSGYRAGGRPS
eukprot:7383423-Prymnesium_polylepis.1